MRMVPMTTSAGLLTFAKRTASSLKKSELNRTFNMAVIS